MATGGETNYFVNKKFEIQNECTSGERNFGFESVTK
jgi:hypothetical protein